MVRKGIDIYLDLYIPFTTTLLGGKIEIPTLKGNYTLTIPELTASGTVLRLKNRGVKALNRDYYGDMFVTVKAEPPKKLDSTTKKKLQELEDMLGDSYPKYNEYLNKTKDLK